MKKIEDVVKANLCTGCGICVSENPEALHMEWNDFGFLIPKTIASETKNAIKVCPFNIQPEEAVKDEDVLANIFLPESTNRDSLIGKYVETYIGYSNQYRETSSSGGIATYVFEYLLRNKIVDHLFIVKEINGTYEFQLFSNIAEITEISKTRYYPVTLEYLFKKIEQISGKIAVSGVACFIKGIRLKQYYNPKLKDKIPFLVGIICGGLKSSFFSDFLAQSAKIKGTYFRQEYRIKDANSTASDYSFGAFSKDDKFHTVKMAKMGDMWGTGMFKSRACDFCTDVLTELADISVGDAWLPEYRQDGMGNNIIVTRTRLADEIIQYGIQNSDLFITKVDKNRIIESQKSSFSHRQDGIKFRTQIAKLKGQKIPYYRERVIKEITFPYKLVQLLRAKTRTQSLKIWKQTKEIEEFNKKMKFYIKMLHFFTKVYHKLK